MYKFQKGNFKTFTNYQYWLSADDKNLYSSLNLLDVKILKYYICCPPTYTTLIGRMIEGVLLGFVSGLSLVKSSSLKNRSFDVMNKIINQIFSRFNETIYSFFILGLSIYTQFLFLIVKNLIIYRLRRLIHFHHYS